MKKKLSLLLFISLNLFVFKTIFSFDGVISGDWPFFFDEQLQRFPSVPNIWNPYFNLGGLTISPWIDSYLYFIVFFFVNTLHLPWTVVHTLTFFIPALILSALGSILLFKTITSRYSVLPAFIFLFNTYSLMILGGGQMGIVLAYSVAPFVLTSFINLLQAEKPLRSSLVVSLVVGLQVLFDIRVAYVTLLSVFLYWLVTFFQKKPSFRSTAREVFFCILLPVMIVFLFHSYWILPHLIFHVSPQEVLGSAHTSLESVRFFSFAQLSQTISLLHPFWPENIFGKVGFMQAEFILVPVLAYSSLLFASIKLQNHPESFGKLRTSFDKNARRIVPFVFLGLIGAFLAKGANPPLGEMYLWFFDHIPGFFMFRDPTKWYVLIALSYSVMIPFGVLSMYDWLKASNQFSISIFQFPIKSKLINFQNIFLLLISAIFLFLIRPAFIGQLSGTFEKHTIPAEYEQLKDFIHKDKGFYRTLWVPRRQRFGYYSDRHPAVDAEVLFRTSSRSALLKNLKDSQAIQLFRETGVRYVIVPYDSEGELFLNDREYDEKEYQQVVQVLEDIPWVKKTTSFGKIRIYELPEWDDKITSKNKETITWTMESPSEYTVKFDRPFTGTLVFSERFDEHWLTRSGEKEYQSKEYKHLLNSFEIAEPATNLSLFYTPQRIVIFGQILSIMSLSVVIVFTVFLHFIKKKL